SSETFFRLCMEEAGKLQSTQKLIESYGGLIDVLYENKKYPESVRVCRELLELKLDDGKREREYLLAIPSEEGGGVDFYGPSRASRFDPASPLHASVHRLLIQGMAKQGKYDQALKLVDNLLNDKENARPVWMDQQLKGWVLNEANKFEEAAGAYEEAIKSIKE